MKLNLIRNAGLAFSFLTLVACKQEGPKLLLPIYGEKKVHDKDTVYHTIKDFKFTNQYGEAVSKETVNNKIYIANFFFATCQSICPEMSTNLTTVQKAFEKGRFLIDSFSFP